MKIKIFLSSLAVMSVLGSMHVNANLYYDSIEYTLLDDKAVITGIESSSETIEIPGMIDGKIVCEIRENAFYKCDTLKKIIIPKTIEKIGHHAFYECTALETAEINGNISQINEGCFYGCESLSDVKLPESLKRIEKYSFYGCENLESIEFPKSLTEIGKYAFANCASLSDTILSDNLVEIGNYAFYNCQNLKNINVPDSVISMGECSLGFYGSEPELVSDFCIFGDDNSLGKAYAEENSINFENIDDNENEQENKKISPLPAAVTISSIAGLMFFRFLEKLKFFRKKYEYEC